ncbi:MAG: type VI secretion system baseplate subunit TssF [Rhodospirillaceae bacterium]|nr:type VI secretion system baseplate subunit TssF [Rhodospirillaceae bacterium]
MVDHLLSYYNRELEFLRKMGAAFADAHPRIAGRLRLTADAVEDPHVQQLLQSVAFLTARLRHRIDDDFPELTDALLGVLYPHYLHPIPAMSIVHFRPEPDLDANYVIPAGLELESEAVGGDSCRFRTCYDTTLWPVAVANASLTGRPLVAPNNPRASGAVASLRLTLECLDPQRTLTDLGLDTLRVFLRGPPQTVNPLYELLLNNAVSVALAENAVDPNPVILEPGCLKPVGFEPDEGLLPYPPQSLIGYRLITEFFTFPEKYLFVDITGLDTKTLVKAGRTMDVFIYLNRAASELERTVSAETFALGCTPIINLFDQRAEPIDLTHTISEYRVVPDARRPQATEVYEVRSVSGKDQADEVHPYRAFYSVKHAAADDGPGRFWYATRRPAGQRDPGTEVFLSLVDLDFNPSSQGGWTLSVKTTCLNRDLPSRLPFGGGHPHLRPTGAAPPVSDITCLIAPTPTLRPAMGPRGYWRLISHLALNHLSLQDATEGADALREIFKLYDFRDSADSRALIDSILSVRTKPATARVRSGGMSGLCRGVEVIVEFDGERFSGTGLFLMASVLDRFLGLYATVNSFTRLVVWVRGQTAPLRTFPARAGLRPLV